jgi:hypothetical protein
VPNFLLASCKPPILRIQEVVDVEEVAGVFMVSAMDGGTVMIRSMEDQITIIRMAAVDHRIEEDLGVGVAILIRRRIFRPLDRSLLLPLITVATEDILEVAVLARRRMTGMVVVPRLREVIRRRQTTTHMHVMILMEVIMDMEGITPIAVADMVIVREVMVDKAEVAVIAVMAVMVAMEVKAVINLVVTAIATLAMEEDLLPIARAGVADEVVTINLLTHIVRYL